MSIFFVFGYKFLLLSGEIHRGLTSPPALKREDSRAVRRVEDAKGQGYIKEYLTPEPLRLSD